ncbi:Unknown protein, partial [Striga hermonthica]
YRTHTAPHASSRRESITRTRTPQLAEIIEQRRGSFNSHLVVINSIRFSFNHNLSSSSRLSHVRRARSPGTPTGHSGRFVPRLPSKKVFDQGDPRVVDEWVQGLEIIFEVMNCPDRYHMLCAQIQLTSDARLWWQAYWCMRPGEKDGCTWDQFKELIREKYYPSYYRADMERQFLALTQGTRTVDEYEREFTRLGAFVPDLVGTEAKRAHRFTDGLRPTVRHNIVGHGVQTYARAVAIAQEVDASIRREATQTPAQPVAQPPAQPKVAQPSTNQKKRKLRGGPDNWRTHPRQYPECPTCGKHHRGECLVGQN